MDPRYPLSGVEVEEEKVSLGRQEVIKDLVLVDLQLQFVDYKQFFESKSMS